MNQVTKTVAIKNFLIHRTHADLAELYNEHMEVQVLAAQDGGSKIDGEFKGKSWSAYTDGTSRWKSFRIPLFAFREFRGGLRAARGVNFLPACPSRSALTSRDSRARNPAQPARLRSSVSWAIQVFRRHRFEGSLSVFSS